MRDINYDRDAKIDHNSLDIEWLDQTQLGIDYIKHQKILNHKVRVLTERKKTIRSLLIREANEDPETCCNKAKPNASDIEAYYRSNDRYQEVINELMEAESEAEFAEMARWEICVTKKKALEELGKLHHDGYFSGPSVPRELDYEIKRKRRDIEANQTVANSKKFKRTT